MSGDDLMIASLVNGNAQGVHIGGLLLHLEGSRFGNDGSGCSDPLVDNSLPLGNPGRKRIDQNHPTPSACDGVCRGPD